MKTINILLLGIIVIFMAASLLKADVVDTKNGARLVGKIVKIEGGSVYLNTAYAGEIAVKQAEIAAIATDETVAVRLASGTRIDGRVSTESGELKVVGKDGTVTTTVDKVAASWAAGGEDPKVTAMQRKWTFQTAVDIAGKSGNTKSTSVGAGFVAALVSPQDTLKFYGNYQYATTTTSAGAKTTSADQSKAGIDYASFFSERCGWFVRSELGNDRVEGVDLRSTTDFGGTYRFVNNDCQKLVGRLGAGYRFESYITGPDNKGAVLSTGLSHSYVINSSCSIVTELQYLPSFEDFADYRFLHDSALEIPISSGFWKLRIGVSNQYNSRPLAGRKSMDTMYYTRLLLNWK
jgi:putative salt-induced outer membrane protein YdiY